MVQLHSTWSTPVNASLPPVDVMQLRSSDVNTCVIQRTRTRLADRSFAQLDHVCGTVSLLNFATSTFLYVAAFEKSFRSLAPINEIGGWS